MKTQVILPAAVACLCLASCATDPAIFEKKKNTSIGRFGYTPPSSETVATAPEAGGAETPAAPAPAPAAAQAAPTPAPAPAAEEAPKKKSGGFFSWFRKDKTEDAPAATVVEEKPAEKKTTAPPKQDDFAAAPEPQRKKGALSDDIRLPNLLGLPEDKELKATNPSTKKDEKEGAVISRPPVEKKD